jgi:hypothetical protein
MSNRGRLQWPLIPPDAHIRETKVIIGIRNSFIPLSLASLHDLSEKTLSIDVP